MKKIAKFVSNFSWFLIILFLIITFLLGYFTKYIKVQAELVTGLPDNLPEVIAYNKVKEIFPSSDVIFVILESDSIFLLNIFKKFMI
jgi:predicted RND superfamily exporter protein